MTLCTAITAYLFIIADASNYSRPVSVADMLTFHHQNKMTY